MRTHSWRKHGLRVLSVTPLLWFIACSSDGVSGGPSSSAGSSSASGASALAGAAGAVASTAGAPTVGGGAAGLGAGAGGLMGVAGGVSTSGAGGSAAGANGGSTGTGGAANSCVGVTCGTGQTCTNGTCKCMSGMLCSDGCFDTQNDQNHCGDCGTKCAADGACVSGKCVNPMCNPDTQQRSGHITTYNLATSEVACRYPTNTLPQYYGAMNQYDWNDSGVCGACVEITNGGTKLTVQITDECPDIDPNKMWCFQGSHHIDLNGAAYSALGANNNPAVNWKYVACSTTGNIKFNFDKACQEYYLAVTPMNAKNLMSKMEVMTKDGYVALPRNGSNMYELKTGAGTGALTFRLTDIYNHVVTDTVTMAAGQIVQGSKQFAACP